MYRKIQRVNRGSYNRTSKPFCPDVRISRPLSFYVRGGVDISGVDKRPPLPSVADDPEAPGMVNLLTDATVDKLDLFELAGHAEREAEIRALEKATGDYIEKPE